MPPTQRARLRGRSLVVAHRFRLLALLGIAAAMAARSPQLLTTPRFWAEEGSVYFRHAWQASWWSSLFFYYENAGYVNLSASLPAAIAGQLLPLGWAPGLTTWFSLCLQLVPFAIILWGRAEIWREPHRKALFCATLLVAPNTSYAWLNTTNAQVWCCLIAFTLLLEPTRRMRVGVFTAASGLLLFCFLSGPYGLFLLPLFVARWYAERSPRNAALICVGALAACIQLAAVVNAQDAMSQKRRPLAEIELTKTANAVLSAQVVEPILGQSSAVRVFRSLQARREGNPVSAHLSIVLLSLGVAVLALGLGNAAARLSLAAFCLVSLATSLFAFDFHPTGRYSTAAALLFLCTLCCAVDPGRGDRKDWRARARRGTTLACMALLAVAICLGALGYRRGPFLFYTPEAPVWSQEVARWRDDPGYDPRIWPYRPVQWSIGGLPPRERP